MNAHSIHLDLNYCRTVEGHRNLLVHGPMTCTLLMTLLNAQVSEQGKAISKFEYRNVAPLYADEELKLCLVEGADGKGYRLWAENGRGEVAVKAEAEVTEVK
jgi:hydroxyacyl-ACP dehydratase HTD2-like protein with hotdog domain